MQIPDRITFKRFVQTVVVLALIAVVTSTGLYQYALSVGVGQQSEQWYSPEQEATYIVGQYNGTFTPFYFAKNHTGYGLSAYQGYELLESNDDDILQYCVNQSTANGGLVYVKEGTYSASVTLKANVRLVLSKGAATITVSINAGATAILEDWNAGRVRYWKSGSLVWDQNLDSASLTASSGIFGSWMNGTNVSISDQLWWDGYNRTDLLAHPQDSFNFLVYQEGGITYSRTGNTWQVTPSTIQACVDAVTASGGSIIVKNGTYSEAVTLKNATRLVLDRGCTGVTVTINAGATAILEDYNAAITWVWSSGVLVMQYNNINGLITGTYSNFGQYWVGTANRTDVLANPQEPYSYLIYVDPTTGLYMGKAANGTICWSSTNAGQVFNNAFGNASNGLVYAKNGLYNINANLTMTSNSAFICESTEGCTLNFTNDLYYNYLVVPSTAQNVTLAKFKITGIGCLLIQGNSTLVQDVTMTVDETDSYAFWVYTNNATVDDVEYLRCKALSCHRYGFVATGLGTNALVSNLRYIDCQAIDCGITAPRWGLYPGGFAFGTNLQDTLISGCLSKHNWDEGGFHFEDAYNKTNVQLINCISEENGQNPSPADGNGFLLSSGIKAVGCTARNNLNGAGFLINNNKVNDVAELDACKDYGGNISVRAYGSSGHIIIDDFTSEYAPVGLYLSYGGNFHIKDFKILDATGDGGSGGHGLVHVTRIGTPGYEISNSEIDVYVRNCSGILFGEGGTNVIVSGLIETSQIYGVEWDGANNLLFKNLDILMEGSTSNNRGMYLYAYNLPFVSARIEYTYIEARGGTLLWGIVGGSITTVDSQTVSIVGATGKYATCVLTENTGSTTNATATTFSFLHGRDQTPTNVQCSFNTSAVSSWTWTANATAINVTVVCSDQVFVPYNGKIANITESDTNKHLLTLANSTGTGAITGETRKVIQVLLCSVDTSGAGAFYVYPNEGTYSVTIRAVGVSVDSIVIADGSQRLQYSLETSGNVMDLYCFGYVVEAYSLPASISCYWTAT